MFRSDRDDAWRPDVDWFLRPNTVTAILEGKYDWTKNNGQPKESPSKPSSATMPEYADEMLTKRTQPK